MNLKILLTLGVLHFSAALAGEMAMRESILVNDKKIILKDAGSYIDYALGSQISNLEITVADDAVTITSYEERTTGQKVTGIYNELGLYKSLMEEISSSESLLIKEDAPIIYNEHYINNDSGNICISTNGVFELSRSFVTTPGEVVFTAPKITGSGFIRTPGMVKFNAPTGNKHWLKGVEWISASTTKTSYFQGTLNFRSPSTDDRLLIVGIKSVRLILNKTQ